MASVSDSTNPPEPTECPKLREIEAKLEEALEAVREWMEDLGCN